MSKQIPVVMSDAIQVALCNWLADFDDFPEFSNPARRDSIRAELVRITQSPDSGLEMDYLAFWWIASVATRISEIPYKSLGSDAKATARWNEAWTLREWCVDMRYEDELREERELDRLYLERELPDAHDSGYPQSI